MTNKEFIKEEKILNIISDIYIFILIILFPLLVDKTGFFHILEYKWNTYLYISCSYLLISILVYLYYFIFKKTNFFKNKKLHIVQKFAIIYLIINIVSCFMSPFFKNYNLFIGVGRGEGLIMSMLYILTFLAITFFAKFKKKYIIYFSVSSIIINFISILQYVGFNPFNMYQGDIGTHNVSFMGTIGNINSISAMYCLLLSTSYAAFIFIDKDKKINKFIHLLSILMGSFIFGIIDVESGKVAFLIVMILTLPYILTNNKYLSRFMIIISTVLSSYLINFIINPEYHYDLGKINFYFQFNYIAILFLLVIILLLVLSKVIRKCSYNYNKNKKIINNIYLLFLFLLLYGIFILYLFDFNLGILHEIHEILHGNFDDKFGTYRIFLWKRTLQIFPEYPLLGSGPDTFAIRFMAKFTNDIAAIGPLTINDTAANVYLTILINLGLVGLINYLLFIYFQINNGLKNRNINSIIMIVPFICYLIQDFFNLSVVIVTPLFWLVMGLYFCSTNNLQNK